MNPVVTTGFDTLARIHMVLCDTLEPSNIGAAARAMKTMGLSRLTLVRPKQFPHGMAVRLAVSANNLLDDAVVVTELAAAVAGCHAVYGVSARQRKIPVEPGDQLILSVTIDRVRGGIWKFKGVASVMDEVACEAELMCTMRNVSGVKAD